MELVTFFDANGNMVIQGVREKKKDGMADLLADVSSSSDESELENIITKAKSRDRGMVEATIKPPRKFPSNSTNTKMTIKAPSIRFRLMVPVVWAMRLLRSRKGSIRRPSGKDFWICSTLSFTA